MSKHTPGPWEAVLPGIHGNAHVIKDEGKGWEGSSQVIAADLYDENHEPSIEELEANAKLIAAAPDLLVACQRALAESVGQPSRRISFDGLEILRSAITKATS